MKEQRRLMLVGIALVAILIFLIRDIFLNAVARDWESLFVELAIFILFSYTVIRSKTP